MARPFSFVGARRARFLAVACAGFLLGGCALVFGFGDPVEDQPGVGVGGDGGPGGAGGEGGVGVGGDGAPVVAGTRPEVWFQKLAVTDDSAGWFIKGSADADRIYVSTTNGSVAALDVAKKGEPLWTKAPGTRLLAGASLQGNRVLVYDADLGVLALDVANGLTVWSNPNKSSASVNDLLSSSWHPPVAAGVLGYATYVASNPKLKGLRVADGAERWQIPADATRGYTGTEATANADHIFAVSRKWPAGDGPLLDAVEATTGVITWSMPAEDVGDRKLTRLWADAELVVALFGSASELYGMTARAYEAETGKFKWEQDVADGQAFVQPVRVGNLFFVTKTGVSVVNPSNGRVSFAGSKAPSFVAPCGAAVCGVSYGNELYRFLETGAVEELGRLAGNFFIGAPANAVFVASNEGVYRYDL